VSEPEIVPPSPDPSSATATGTGRSSDGATPPPPPAESAGAGGIGTEADRQDPGDGAPPANAPYGLTGEPDPNPTQAKSDSGT
jgi:hypothetical protein